MMATSLVALRPHLAISAMLLPFMAQAQAPTGAQPAPMVFGAGIEVGSLGAGPVFFFRRQGPQHAGPRHGFLSGGRASFTQAPCRASAVAIDAQNWTATECTKAVTLTLDQTLVAFGQGTGNAGWSTGVKVFAGAAFLQDRVDAEVAASSPKTSASWALKGWRPMVGWGVDGFAGRDTTGLFFSFDMGVVRAGGYASLPPSPADPAVQSWGAGGARTWWPVIRQSVGWRF